MGGVQISIGGRLEKIQKITGGKEIERGGGGGGGFFGPQEYGLISRHESAN